MDINEYANRLLLDFLDHAHKELSRRLSSEHGPSWFESSVSKHIGPTYIERTKRMLASPMRTVDMDKSEDEMYGVEHLGQILLGNWKTFGDDLGDRKRTEVYCLEIAELRNNLAHRRRSHFLRRAELLRFTQNAALILRALRSSDADRFSAIADDLASGAAPWGPELGGVLPPRDEIVSDFVGRPSELRALQEWFVSDSPHVVVWGYGGAGKSALAYQFARDIQDAGPTDYLAIAWVSAKRREYVEGRERERLADFDDISSLTLAIWSSIFGADSVPDDLSLDDFLGEISATPTLLVIDDVDTILDKKDLSEFLLFTMRSIGTKIVFTSRSKIPGLPIIDVPGFTGDDLGRFIRTRTYLYDLDASECVRRQGAIESVTEGYPLFVDDLLRHSRLDGLASAINDWSQKRGDAAREYALRRQLERLGDPARDVLMALSVANRPLSRFELATVSGQNDDDVRSAVDDLLIWQLLNPAPSDPGVAPGFSMSANTRRLVQRTYRSEPRMAGYSSAFRSLSGEYVPSAMRRAIGRAIGNARAKVVRGDVLGAAEDLNDAMIGDLVSSVDLLGALGWVYSRRSTTFDLARQAFERAERHGATKEDTYYHWARMETDVAAEVDGPENSTAAIKAWALATTVTELGIERCGSTRALCELAGYARTREAKLLEKASQFVGAQSAFAQAREHFREALKCPPSETTTIGRVYRGLVVSLEGLEDRNELEVIFNDWHRAAPTDPNYESEFDRLQFKFNLHSPLWSG
jgi:NB-ARC domain-containing protein